MGKTYVNTATPPLAPPPIPKTTTSNWINRHWKWFVPLVVLMLFAGIATFATLLLTVMKSSDAYTGAWPVPKSVPLSSLRSEHP